MTARSNPSAPVSHVERVASEIVDAAIWLHRRVGPGLMESVYRRLLEKELVRRGRHVEREKVVRFEIDGLVFTGGLRTDLIGDRLVVVELKSVEKLHPVHWKQVLTYIRVLHLPLGLLLNFGGATLKEGGIRRVINNYYPDSR